MHTNALIDEAIENMASSHIEGIVAKPSEIKRIFENFIDNMKPFRSLVTAYLELHPTYRNEASLATITKLLERAINDEPALRQEIENLKAAESAVLQQGHPTPDIACTPDAPASSFIPQTSAETNYQIRERIVSNCIMGLASTITVKAPYFEWRGLPSSRIPPADEHYRFVEQHVVIAAIALSQHETIIATGDPGCGKTEFFRQLAARLKMPFTVIPLDGSLRRPDLIGSFRQIATEKGSCTPFVHGIIPQAISKPGIVLFDEIDQTMPELQYMMHGIYEGRGITIPENAAEFIPIHPDCYIVAAANTKGRGSDNGLTTARFEMSEATRDRFSYWLEFTYPDEQDEIAILTAKTAVNAVVASRLVKLANLVRQSFASGQMSQSCSTRLLLKTARLWCDMTHLPEKERLDASIRIVIANRANREDADAIINMASMI